MQKIRKTAEKPTFLGKQTSLYKPKAKYVLFDTFLAS
jgi:hypothetical protein